MAREKRERKEVVIPSSGNVFADLGFVDAEERQIKVRLAFAINGILQRRRLTQAAAARQLNVDQPRIVDLLEYRLDSFPVERLMHFLTALDQDVEIVIRSKPRSRRPARIIVTAA
jgi:predicted XRE-type DNA-binding protein